MKNLKLSMITRNAWAIARMGAEKFGGKAKDYLSQALKQAWNEIKEKALVMVTYVKENGEKHYTVASHTEVKINKKTGKEYLQMFCLKGIRNVKNFDITPYSLIGTAIAELGGYTLAKD